VARAAGCNREIAFYKASAIAQGCNIVRRELGLAVTYVPAADPALQIDVVPGGVPHRRRAAPRKIEIARTVVAARSGPLTLGAAAGYRSQLSEEFRRISQTSS